MPKTNAKVDPHVQKAMGFLKSFSNMAVPLAIKLAEFRPQEQACRDKQIWIHCQFDKKACKHITVQMSPPTTPISIDLANNNEGLLSVVVCDDVRECHGSYSSITSNTTTNHQREHWRHGDVGGGSGNGDSGGDGKGMVVAVVAAVT